MHDMTMRRRSNLRAAGVTLFGSIWLAGCFNPSALRHDLPGSAAAFGDTSNKQMLLNLARLANHEPVFFLQLGTYSSQYTLTGGAGFTPSAVKNTPGFYNGSSGVIAPNGPSTVAEYAKESLTLGGTASLGITESPTFQYLPLAGTNLTGPVLTPIPDRIFFNFYEQGYPADILARLMVAQVQLPTKPTGNLEFWVNNPNGTNYAEFLRFCTLLKNAQQAHALVVRQEEGDGVVIYIAKDPKLADVTAAVAANLSVSYETHSGAVTVKKPAKGPALVEQMNVTNVTLPDPGPIFSGCINDDSLPACICRRDRLTDDKHAYFAGDTQTGAHALEEANRFALAFTNRYKLFMRTVESAMYDVAREEQKFRERAEVNKVSKKTCPAYPGATNAFFGHDEKGPYALVDRPLRQFDVDDLPSMEAEQKRREPFSAPGPGQPPAISAPGKLSLGAEADQSVFSFMLKEEAFVQRVDPRWHGTREINLRAPDLPPDEVKTAEDLYPLETNLVNLFLLEATNRMQPAGLPNPEKERTPAEMYVLTNIIPAISNFHMSFTNQYLGYTNTAGSGCRSNLVYMMVKGLNNIVRDSGKILAQDPIFSRVGLRPETVELATKLLKAPHWSGPGPDDFETERKKANIMVLEDAFPQELKKQDFEKNPFNPAFDSSDIADPRSFAKKIVGEHEGTAPEVTPEVKYLREYMNAIKTDDFMRCWHDYTNKWSKADALNKRLVAGLLNEPALRDFLPPIVSARSSFKVRPLMKLTCVGDETRAATEVISVKLSDRRGLRTERFFVGDPVDIPPTGPEVDISQNRTVFTILTYLFAQASVNTQNIPVQQLIQVH